MNCIFCHKDSSTSKSVEHIVPESLGNKNYFLPKGYVCDNCNHYFAIKVEKELLSQPYFVSLRFRNEILTKKGKLVKQKMFFPNCCKSAEVVMQTTADGLIASIADKQLYDNLKTDKTYTMIGPYIPEPDYPNVLLSRFIAKCAYEYFLYKVGSDKYDLCVQEFLNKQNDILKELREYARYGIGKYWNYNQRRIYSESALFHNKKDNSLYETLHEMNFIVKNHTILSNGQTEAEIYFVLVIGGIEYTICLSDKDNISGIQQFIEKNGNHPLLEYNNEEQLSFGLSN